MVKMPDSIIEVRNLTVAFRTDEGEAIAVQDVSFHLYFKETLALVGESGCGKTVTALSLLRLINAPNAKILSGEILFEGKNLLECSEKEMREIRGNKISMVFQEPMTSLNPVFSVGNQVLEALLAHRRIPKSEAKKKVVEMFQRVGIPDAASRYHAYPYELSGGMRQRALIAMALVCEPKVLIADEPTTALDVTIQSQILRLISQLQRETGMSVLIITHDLGVIAQVADRIAIMYASKIVEHGKDRDIFFHSLHPYTQGLLRSIAPDVQHAERLPSIPGVVPIPTRFPDGCHFSPRCEHATSHCHAAEPSSEDASGEHSIACWEWKNLMKQKAIA